MHESYKRASWQMPTWSIRPASSNQWDGPMMSNQWDGPMASNQWDGPELAAV